MGQDLKGRGPWPGLSVCLECDGVVEGFEEAAGSDLCLESATLTAVGTRTDEAGDRKEPFQSPGERCWWWDWSGSSG